MALQKKNSVKETPAEVVETEAVAEEAATPAVEVVADEPTALAVAQESSPHPAVHTDTTPAAVESKPADVSSVSASLESQGAHGLELDWTSFETIVLDKGEFCTSDGEELDVDPGTGFDVIIMRTEEKFAVSSSHEDDEDREVVYCASLDEIKTEGTAAFEAVQKWKEEDGVDYSHKKYVDAFCVILDEKVAEQSGEVATLQISPASVGKFSGYMHTMEWARGLKLGEYITRVSRGKKITKTKNDFYPWKAKFNGLK